MKAVRKKEKGQKGIKDVRTRKEHNELMRQKRNISFPWNQLSGYSRLNNRTKQIATSSRAKPRDNRKHKSPFLYVL
jgi:hypothetical protein